MPESSGDKIDYLVEQYHKRAEKLTQMLMLGNAGGGISIFSYLQSKSTLVETKIALWCFGGGFIFVVLFISLEFIFVNSMLNMHIMKQNINIGLIQGEVKFQQWTLFILCGLSLFALILGVAFGSSLFISKYIVFILAAIILICLVSYAVKLGRFVVTQKKQE